MIVREAKNKKRNEDGQSIIEFLLMLPLLAAISMMLIKVNTVIQVSIVNQQYARAQALSLTYHNSIYPRISLQSTSVLSPEEMSQMIMGVSDNLSSDENFFPEATTQSITRPGQPTGQDDPQELRPRRRGNVRVRTTVSLCTQDNQKSFPNDNPAFTFCRSPLQ